MNRLVIRTRWAEECFIDSLHCLRAGVWALAAIVAIASSPAWAQPLTAAISAPGNIAIKLEPVAQLGPGLLPIDGAAIPGDSKLYVGTYIAGTASIQVVDPVAKTISPTPFLTFAGTGVPITGQGLQGITFSPNFNDDSKPGYRRFYTFQMETGPGAGNIMFPHPEVSAPGQIGTVREWTANAEGTAIDTAIPARLVLSFGGRSSNGHLGGGLKFGPDGYLYMATGDSGGSGDGYSGNVNSTNDGFTGRDNSGTSTDVPAISNGQDITNPLGKVLRIAPYTSNADGSPRATPDGATAKSFLGATRYFIPGDNPFVDNPQNIYFTPIGPIESQTPVGPMPELYAFGFRNPWKLSFDMAAELGDAPYVADVGSRYREEIVLAEAGHNYGWPYREGDVANSSAVNRPLNGGNLPFLKQTSPGVFQQYDLDPTLSDPTQMSPAMAVLGTHSGTMSPPVFADRPGSDTWSDSIYGWEYGDGNSVTGGFVYRGSEFPELYGKYVFGMYQFLIQDPTRPSQPEAATSGGGRLLYLDPEEASANKTVRMFNFATGYGIDGTRIPGTHSALGDLLGISQGDDGELYAMFVSGDIKRIAASLVGDYNNDGVVDAADYTVWRDNLGATSQLENDLIGGEIGIAHYDQWKASYAATDLTGGAEGLSVPEPGSACLAFLSLVGLLTSFRSMRTNSHGLL